jgi:hypothetical protein
VLESARVDVRLGVVFAAARRSRNVAALLAAPAGAYPVGVDRSPA